MIGDDMSDPVPQLDPPMPKSIPIRALSPSGGRAMAAGHSRLGRSPSQLAIALDWIQESERLWQRCYAR